MVAVKNCPVHSPSRACRIPDRVLDQAGAHVVRYRVADQAPGVHVDDGGQVQEFPFPAGQVGDVADIELVAIIGIKVPVYEVIDDLRLWSLMVVRFFFRRWAPTMPCWRMSRSMRL